MLPFPISQITSYYTLYTRLTTDKTKSLSIWLVSIWIGCLFTIAATHVKSKSVLLLLLKCSWLWMNCIWPNFLRIFSLHFPNYENRSVANKKLCTKYLHVEKQERSILFIGKHWKYFECTFPLYTYCFNSKYAVNITCFLFFSVLFSKWKCRTTNSKWE